ncbi:hypothetical protein FOA52_008265 [Chlamydomonas sp. UWO 241]|nr:hypothetical protein FOA52_008265 [Chlamydomonas sp. UWO 241]
MEGAVGMAGGIPGGGSPVRAHSLQHSHVGSVAFNMLTSMSNVSTSTSELDDIIGVLPCFTSLPSVTTLLQQLPTCSIYNPLSHFGSDRLQPGAALAASNSLMAAASLPVRNGAHITFDPVCPSSILFRLGTTWGFPG